MKDNKYGVPIGADFDDRTALKQPKFTNRYRVFFQNIGSSSMSEWYEGNENARSALTAQVESFSRPSVEFNNKPVTSFIGRGFVHGRPLLSEATFVIRDEITNSAILYLYRQVQAQIDKFYPKMNDNGEFIKSHLMGQDTKFNIIMEVLDGRTNLAPLEVWELYGCTFNSVTFSDNSYEDEIEIAKITVKCSVDSIDVYRPARGLFQGREYDDTSARIIESAERIEAERIEAELEREERLRKAEFDKMINSPIDGMMGDMGGMA